MFIRRFSAIAATALLLAPLGAGVAHGSDYVVLDSDVAGIEPGLVSAGNAQITVPEGATVLLIDPEGATRVVSGPFSGPVSEAGTTAQADSVLNRLTAGRDQERTTLGATRAPKFEGGELKE